MVQKEFPPSHIQELSTSVVFLQRARAKRMSRVVAARARRAAYAGIPGFPPPGYAAPCAHARQRGGTGATFK